MIQVHCIYYALYVYYYYTSSASDHEALDPRSWRPLLYTVFETSDSLWEMVDEESWVILKTYSSTPISDMSKRDHGKWGTFQRVEPGSHSKHWMRKCPPTGSSLSASLGWRQNSIINDIIFSPMSVRTHGHQLGFPQSVAKAESNSCITHNIRPCATADQLRLCCTCVALCICQDIPQTLSISLLYNTVKSIIIREPWPSF